MGHQSAVGLVSESAHNGGRDWNVTGSVPAYGSGPRAMTAAWPVKEKTRKKSLQGPGCEERE